MRHALYGIAIDSELDLPELEPAASGCCDLRIRMQPLAEPQGEWTELWVHDDGSPWTRVSRQGGGYRIRYVGQVDFLYSPRERSLAIDVQSCAPELLRHLLLDQVLPLILSTSVLTLHASAVAIAGRAAAFVGRGGLGKSTLAMLVAGLGHQVLCDDVLVVHTEGQAPTAVPAYKGLRLCTDVTTMVAPRHGDIARAVGRRKVRVTSGFRFADRTHPLKDVFVLDLRVTGRTEFHSLTPRDLAVALVEHSYRLEQHDAAALALEVTRACVVAEQVRGWRLSYPRDPENWTDVAKAVACRAMS